MAYVSRGVDDDLVPTSIFCRVAACRIIYAVIWRWCKVAVQLFDSQMPQAIIPEKIFLLHITQKELRVGIHWVLVDMLGRAPSVTAVVTGHEGRWSEDYRPRVPHHMEIEQPVVAHTEANCARLEKILDAVALCLQEIIFLAFACVLAAILACLSCTMLWVKRQHVDNRRAEHLELQTGMCNNRIESDFAINFEVDLNSHRLLPRLESNQIRICWAIATFQDVDGTR